MSLLGPFLPISLLKKTMICSSENSWMMFDHVKRFQGWRTMACHVYDHVYCKVMSIAIDDM
jgi:hypothetical protein